MAKHSNGNGRANNRTAPRIDRDGTRPGAGVPVTRRTFLVTAGVSLAAGTAAGAATVYGMPGGGSTAQNGAATDAPGGAPGAGGGANTTTFDYTGTYTGAITADGEEIESANETHEATEADVVAALAQNGGALTLTEPTLIKSGDDTNGDNCNFYGVNSILTVVGEDSSAVVDGGALTSTSEGSNGIFATDGATVLVNGASIHTSAGNARGLDATYGGTIVAANMTIETKGDHCAGIATDRGGGSISCAKATVSTAGSGSPILYSTGNIQVSGITGQADDSQLAGMEGLNTILIHNSELTSTVTGRTASDPVANGVIIYQSTSGDAEATTGETATFQAVGSTLKSAIAEGALFYLTNTEAAIVVSDSSLDFDTSAARLLYAAGNDANNWGQAGSNGASATFTGRGQELEGDVCADSISSVELFLLDGTTWTGAAEIEKNANGSTSDAPLTVNVDATSTWVVTGDCEVSALNVENGGKVVDESGSAARIVAGGATVAEGDGVTVTVTGSYGTQVSAGDATELKGSDDMIDRSAFDKQFGTSTAWTM